MLAPAGATAGSLVGELESLREIMQQLQMAKQGENVPAKEKDGKKRKKDKKKGRHKKNKKGASSSSSGSSKSSSSSSSDSDAEKSVMRWSQKKVKLTPDMVTFVNTVRFKRRSDVLNFHHRFPGSLAALFLWQVKQKVGGAQPKNTQELRRVDSSAWANLYSGLKEVRDQKELAFLCKVLLELGMDNYGAVADLLAQRCRELLAAKRENGNWDKASVLSLQPSAHSGSASIPEGAFVV